jgi:hypothetical protein
MLLTLFIVSAVTNIYLLDKIRTKNQQLTCQADDIQYWKIVSEEAQRQYNLLLKWNQSWR